jgi:membrane carboxypeptidase/penicillin-binding protein
VGFDKEYALKDRRGAGITGGRGAAPIWTAFMQRAMEGEPTREFTVPAGIHFEEIDPQTGRPPDALTRSALRVALTVHQSPDGTVARGAAGPVLALPATEGRSLDPPPTAADGITEEDLPLDN